VNIKPGDFIINRTGRIATIWKVLEILSDGKLRVEFVRGKRLPNNGLMERVISRPEDYRKL
jgi:hypothetical protein